MTLDVARIRQDFPILNREVHGGVPLVYLDSAATSQKPQMVIDAERDFYEVHNAAVHRGAHALAEESTLAYEEARRDIAQFIGANPDEIVYVKNATEAINLVAYGFSNATAKSRMGNSLSEGEHRFVLEIGDEILLSEMEHHANLIPWQEVALKTGAVLKFIPLTDDGRLDLSSLSSLVCDKTKVISVVHQSNILGTINDLEPLRVAARSVNAWFVVDACQSVPHMQMDVATLGADFVAFSGHKMLGPLGIGVLWGSSQALSSLPVFITGGSMIKTVHLASSTYADSPTKFEAGTPMAAQAVGLGAAARYLSEIGMDKIAQHEHALTEKAVKALQEIPGLDIVGPNNSIDRGSAISFVIKDIHPHDVGQVLDSKGVAVRVGHHCAWPVCRRYGVPATTRASFYLYNDESDIDALVAGIYSAQKFFGVA
ncbi:MAG: hypothetical protein RIS75_1303 [Actinomycetota bacterium]|jgi:cysteine desulfurase/selenocysteine lyase